MDIYDKNGYLDFEKIMKDDNPFVFILGARAIGKTYGSIRYMLDHDIKFIYMRRTQTQADLIRTPALNPFKPLEEEGYETITKPIAKNVTGVYAVEDDKPTGSPLAYILALSTVSNIRGFDASDVDVVIYDEFIGEKHEKPISNEGLAFLNAIETISRNRELKGHKPLKVFCLSNTNDLVNAIFIELKLVTVVEKMIKEGKDYRSIKDRGVSIYLLHDSPISRQKASTALYKLAGNGVFTGMALENDFSQEYMAMVKSQSLKEYKALVKVGELCIYKHKSRRQYYVTAHSSGKPEVYDSSEIEIRRFATDYYFLKLSYMNRHVYFETYLLQILFERYFKL